MLKFFASAALVLALVSPAHAACDKAQAKEALDMIEQTVATRQDSPGSVVVWYNWRDNWDRMSAGQKREMVQGIGGLEQCLTGKAIRIRYAGKDVARRSLTGKIELYD